jgi:hypothetical protein
MLITPRVVMIPRVAMSMRNYDFSEGLCLETQLAATRTRGSSFSGAGNRQDTTTALHTCTILERTGLRPPRRRLASAVHSTTLHNATQAHHLLLCVRLLPSKLIAGCTDDNEALPAILAVEILREIGYTRWAETQQHNGTESEFWLGLHIFSLVHRYLPCKGWDIVSALHFFSLRYWPAFTLICSVTFHKHCFFFAHLVPAFLFCSFPFWAADNCVLCLFVGAPMLVCIPVLLRFGSLCSFCSLVIIWCSQVVSTVLFALMHAPLLLSHCVSLFPLCMLRFWCFD